MPDPDALQEFSVQTNSFTAEFGRNVGGIVNAVTRSGTNQLHGSAFEYIRNNAVNAANYFAPIHPNGGKQSDGLKRNQYGATLGGPVRMPKSTTAKIDLFLLLLPGNALPSSLPPSSSRWCRPTRSGRGLFRDGHLSFTTLSTVARLTRTTRLPAAEFNPVSVASLNTYIPAPAAGQARRSPIALPNNLTDNQFLVRGDEST